MVRRLDLALMTILCESGDAGRDQLVISDDEYERVEVEEVAAKRLKHWIVRKRSGLPAELA
jgi:hypothetical protein